MSTFGDRLREERERLGFNQSDFGALGGVKKQAQLNYEKGERSPDSMYLASIGKIGADILYLLTGERAVLIEKTVNPREAALLDNYRHCDEEDRAAIDRVVLNAASTQQEVVKKTRDSKKAS